MRGGGLFLNFVTSHFEICMNEFPKFCFNLIISRPKKWPIVTRGVKQYEAHVTYFMDGP